MQTMDPGALEDAPADHVAHQRVRFEASAKRFTFSFGKDRFQVTVKQAAGSQDHAARVARLCFLRFESGDAKTDVQAYKQRQLQLLGGDDDQLPTPKRQKLQNVFEEALPAPAKPEAQAARQKWQNVLEEALPAPAKPEAQAARQKLQNVLEEAMPAPATPEAQAARQKNETRTPALPVGSAIIMTAVSEDQLEDAPLSHTAHQRVKFCDHAQGPLFHFSYGSDHFQVTIGRACNSYEHAARIARLCFLQFESGKGKGEVLAFREKELKALEGRWKQGALFSSGPISSNIKTKKVPAKVSWAKQLGTKFSKAKLSCDPLADI